MFSPRRSSLIALILLASLAGPGSAQVVHGRWLERAGGVPVRGGVVTLLDTSGTEVAQALSDASGSYRLTAPGPGRYRLRAERIGYRDIETQPFGLRAGHVLERDLAPARPAISFEGFVANGKGQCSLWPELGTETLALWRAVRTALTATELTKLQDRLRYDEAEYARALDPGTLEPEARPTLTVRSGLAHHPFVSVPVDTVTRGGFVQHGPHEASYYAPDAEVLLSDAFLRSHCLRIVLPRGSDTAEAGAVGLAFSPVRPGTESDVRGTLWVDTATHELRTLEYGYTGLSGPDADEFGGRVDFARLPSGRWIVSRWYVRTPVGSEAESPTVSHVTWIMERGGVILAVRDAAGVRVYDSTDPIAREALAEEAGRRAQPPPARAGMVRGRLVDATTESPLADVVVMLSAGADSAGPWTGAMSGPDGAFSFSGVVPGAHRLVTRSMGYVEGTWQVKVPPEGLGILLELHSRPVTLEGLTVRARAGAHMRGFERRRERGLGSFLDRAQIEKERPVWSTDLMRMVPGIHVQCSGFSIRCGLTTDAPPALAGGDSATCPVQYFVDGVPVSDFSLDDLSPAEIEGIEVYVHPAEVPVRFDNGVRSRCGVVVIWTRGR